MTYIPSSGGGGAFGNLVYGVDDASTASQQLSISATYNEATTGLTYAFQFPGTTVLDGIFGSGGWAVKLYAKVGVQTTAKNLDVKIRDVGAASDIEEFLDITDSTGGATEDVVKTFTNSNFPTGDSTCALMWQKSGEAAGVVYLRNGFNLVIESV